MVKKVVQGSLLVLVGVLLIASPVYAVSVANALYTADVVATNTGTAETGVSAVCDINTQALLDGNYITSDIKNTALQRSGGDTPYMPGVGSNPWVFWISSIGTETKPYVFYCGGPALQTGFVYFPGTGGMATDDDATLEPSDTFQIEQKGYIDTSAGSNKDLVYKETALQVYISDDEDITAAIIEMGSTATWQSPTSASGTGWTNPSNTYDENTSTYAEYSIPNASWSEWITMPTNSLTCGKVRHWVTRQDTYVMDLDLEVYYSGGWHDIGTGFNDGDWRESSIGSYQDVSSARMRFYNGYTSARWVRLHEFDYNEAGDTVVKSVTAEGITSGLRKLVVEADGTDFTISVYDGSDVLIDNDTVALSGESVPDNANDWDFITNGSMPYMEYHKIWVGGTDPEDLMQHIIYERSTTFQDQTTNDNDATPTFRTTSSDPDVTATFQNFRPIDEAECTAGTTEGSPEMLTTAPDQPPEFYGEEGGGTEHLPGAELINALLGQGGIPSDFFWIMAVYGGAAIAVLLGYHFIRSSLMFPVIIGFIIILFFSLTTGGDPIPLWTLIPYSIINSGLMVSERVFGW